MPDQAPGKTYAAPPPPTTLKIRTLESDVRALGRSIDLGESIQMQAGVYRSAAQEAQSGEFQKEKKSFTLIIILSVVATLAVFGAIIAFVYTRLYK